MAIDLKDKTVIVYDRGNYVNIAQRLSKDFGRVMYYLPTSSPFPKFNMEVIGTGIEGVERIYDFWNNVQGADLIVFPDILDGCIVEYLRSTGKAVYGCGFGEDMELDKINLLEYCKQEGISTGNYKIISGIKTLREYLKENPDRYVKVNFIRGNIETFYSESYDLIEPYIDSLEHDLSPVKDTIAFIVCEPIKPAVEIGSDLIYVNGELPDKGMWGIEIKDSSYVGKVDDYENFPRPIIEVNKKLSKLTTELGFTGNISNEVRVTENGEAYLLDMTPRVPQPPGDLLMYMYKNFSEIVYGAANNNIVEPETDSRYGVQLILKSSWSEKEPMSVFVPEEIRPFFSLKRMMCKEGKFYYIPEDGVEMAEIGSLCFASNSLDDAILEIEAMSKKIKAFDIHCNVEALKKADADINKIISYKIIKSF